MNSTRLKLIVIAILLAGASWVVWRPRPTEAQRLRPAAEYVFVRGFVAASVVSKVDKLKDIALPRAKVFLAAVNTPNNPVAANVTDLSGRFGLKTERRGRFVVCIEADGFRRHCTKEFTLGDKSKYLSTIRLPFDRRSRNATFYGEVLLGDGRHPRGFEPFLGVNSYPTIELKLGSDVKYKAYVNNFGEYIVPVIPIKTDFSVSAVIDKNSLERRIRSLANLRPGQAYPIDFQFTNRTPRVRVMSASRNGKPIQIAPPGSKVTLKAVAEDRDKDKLEYRWLLPGGQVIGPTSDSELTWDVPNRSGRFPIKVLVTDNQGGYARNSFSVVASSGNVPFSGSVVDPDGNSVGGAQIEVNGRLTNANSRGRFKFEVPVADKYVLTIRSPQATPSQPAYGAVSHVYTGSIEGGRWVMRPAQVFAGIDATKDIKLQQKRTQKDCRGSLTSRMDWSKYLGAGLIEWQDGRGNVRSLAEVNRRSEKSVQGVMRLLGRTNPALPRHLARLAKVKDTRYDNKDNAPLVPCRDGVQVEIPANSLENPRTKLAPSGPVEIAISTIDLSTGGQMPGDYSALNSSRGPRSMESFGAGSIEVRSGNTTFNLKSGAKATITIPVDGTQLAGNATLPATIPFLYYNETTGVWEQDGQATLVGSGANAVYKKEVTHFSTMNADILKDGQSCVAVEVDPLAGFTLPFDVEVTMPPSVVNPNVIQVRTLTVDSMKTNVIYNLPNDTNIVLTPIISGTKPDGSAGNVPAGVFVVNTGGPQTSPSNLPPANPDGTYYSETDGTPTGPCGSRVTLTNLAPPSPTDDLEFLQGFHFEASNITEIALTDPTVAAEIEQGAVDYYAQADPRSLRASFNEFRDKNDFGDPLDATEVEWDAQYANSGDLGFGRDMHCRRNVADDGAFDIACYVTNYNQPPDFLADQVDADDALEGLDVKKDATVAMEFSRVENPLGDPNEFFTPSAIPAENRTVKFYVYGTDPDGATIKKADLDGFGERPVPQLCVICHGGQVTSVAADPGDPAGPRKGAFTGPNDILSMDSNFLPFDLHLFTYPAAKSKLAQQTNFKNLNRDIVREVALGNGADGTPIVEMIDTINPAAQASQLENAVIPNWDGGNPASDSHKFYRDVFARACRTCHVAQPFTAPVYTNKVDFQNDIGTVQFRVCNQKIMPHAKRTNDIFWTSLGPNMPGFLQLYGQTFPGWVAAPDSQCGQFFQPGTTPESVFGTQIYPILVEYCSGCHSSTGLANFEVGGSIEDVYTSITTALASNGFNYIVPNSTNNSWIFRRISANPGPRMPQGGPNLFDVGEDFDGNGTPDGIDIENWINAGAIGP